MRSLSSSVPLRASPVPYHSPSPLQAQTRVERMHKLLHKQERARSEAVGRGETFWLRRQQEDETAARTEQECGLARQADIVFFPRLPEAEQLARETWKWDGWDAPLTAAELKEAIHDVNGLNDGKAILTQLISRWRQPSLDQQIAQKFKSLKHGAAGRDPGKSMMRAFKSKKNVKDDDD